MTKPTTASCTIVAIVLILSQCCDAGNKLLVFLIDGFRYDYMDDLQNLPGFREIVENGVKVDYMTPDFPSLSYPNYYSLMTVRCYTRVQGPCKKCNRMDFTNKFSFQKLLHGRLTGQSGRYCEVHHMTGNYMWDENSNKEFLIGLNQDSRLPFWWDGSEPLWVTMQKLNKRVFMYYWPGCEVEILGVRAAFCEDYVYNPSEKNFTDSIELALNALKDNKADMAGIYYEKIDVEGHHFGPRSSQVQNAVNRLDLVLQNLNRKIKDKGMAKDLNVIMFSDHGMTDIKWMEKVIELDIFINMSDIIKMMDRGPVVNLWPRQDKFEEIYRALSTVKNMKVYRKDEFPDRFHYKGGKFVSTLTLVAEPGWFITENKSKLPYWKNDTGVPQAWQYGWHGYDNQFVDMRGFFMAQGPDFKKNFQAGPIRAVDVYNLMCHTLGIKPLPNNGSWSRVECMLSGSTSAVRPSFLYSCVLLLLALLPSVQA